MKKSNWPALAFLIAATWVAVAAVLLISSWPGTAENPWPEIWVAFGTWALVGGTFLLGFYTFRLWSDTKASADRQAAEFQQQLIVAKELADANLQSAESFKKSERAYILPVLNHTNNAGLGGALDAIIARGSDDVGEIEIALAFHNFGRTPGVILQIQADLLTESERGNPADEHFVANPLLGANESTDEVTAKLTVTGKKAAWLRISPTDDDWNDLTLEGFVTFEDVFGERTDEAFVWRYNRKAKRLMPDLFPRVVKPARRS